MRNTCRNAVWRGVAVAVVLGIGLASSASADTILFNPAGTGAAGAVSIGSLNLSAGDALGVGAITPGVGLVAGTSFTLYYETVSTSYNPANGGAPVNFGGQISEVATLHETVQTVTTASNGAVSATFALTPGTTSTVNMYFNPTPIANFVTGTGFVTGNPIFSANLSLGQSSFTDTTNQAPPIGPQQLNQFGTGNYAGVLSQVGNGNTPISLNVTSSNPGFFVTPVLFSSVIAGINTPFTTQAPASTFFNGVVPNVGSRNGITGPDILLNVAGASQAFAIPEPASLAMGFMAIAIAPLVTWQVRRRRARA